MADVQKGGRPVLDGDGAKLQCPTKFVCSDGTGTPITFPISLSSDAVTTLVPPTNAVALVLRPVGEDLDVSSEVSAVTSKYDRIPDGGSEVLPCAGHTAIYIKRAAATATTVYGHWRLIGS